MSYAGTISKVAGYGGEIAGTILSASAANIARKRAIDAANLPGVDINGAYSDSLDASLKAMPEAQQLSSSENQFNTAELQKQLNELIPGYSQMQAQRAQNIGQELQGQLSPDVQAAIARSTAARAAAGGYSGSGASSNLTARDLGLTSLDLQNLGNQQAQGLVSGTPMPNFTTVNQNLGINPQQVLGIRSNERNIRQQIYAEAAGMPGWTGALGAGLMQIGGQMAGSSGGGGGGGGMGGMMGGGGGGTEMVYSGFSPGSTGPIMCWVAREVYGKHNPKWLDFRNWMLTEAPRWFVDVYCEYGERFAAWIANKPRLKAVIRRWMDSKL